MLDHGPDLTCPLRDAVFLMDYCPNLLLLEKELQRLPFGSSIKRVFAP
jgi:hypothetical protein